MALYCITLECSDNYLHYENIYSYTLQYLFQKCIRESTLRTQSTELRGAVWEGRSIFMDRRAGEEMSLPD